MLLLNRRKRRFPDSAPDLQWKIAVGTRPLTKEGAESAIKAARDILSTIPVEDPRKTKGKSR